MILLLYNPITKGGGRLDNSNSGSGRKVARAGMDIARSAAKIAGKKAFLATPFGWVTLLFIAILIFLIIISCFFEIVFRELGFKDPSDYATTMYEIETQNLKGVITSYYGDTGNRGEIDSLFVDWNGAIKSKHSSNMIPSGGALKSSYDAIENDYNAVYEANQSDRVVYDGYDISSDQSSFWNDYTDTFLNIIQNNCSTTDISSIENGNTDVMRSNIKSYISAQSNWSDWEKAGNSVTKTVEHRYVRTDTRSYYTYSGPADKVYQGIDVTKAYYKDELYKLNGVGGHTSAYWEKEFMQSGYWTIHTESQDIYEDVEVDHITCHYNIYMSKPSNTGIDTSDAEFTFIENEESFNKIEVILDFIEGKLKPDEMLKMAASELRSLFQSKGWFSELNKKVSWRDVTSVGMNLSYSNGVAFGDTSLGARAVQCAINNHGNDIYSQAQRVQKGYSDCSSLAFKAYSEAGYNNLWGMTAASLAEYCDKNGSRLNESQLQPGDLIFYRYKGGNGRYLEIDHVAMYCGDIDNDGQAEMVQASSSRGRVCVDKFKTNSHIVMYGRPYKMTVAGNLQSENDIYNFLISCGFSKAGACGIMGNMKTESSSFNPKEEYAGHIGLFQWGGGRRNNLIRYCEQNGLDYTSISGQMNFFIYEMNTKEYAGLSNYLRTTNDPQMAAQEFCAGFERAVTSKPSSSRGDAKYMGSLYPKQYGSYYQAMNKRTGYAASYASKY